MSELYSMERLDEWISSETRYFEAAEALQLENGGQLESWCLAYRTWGRLNAAADNAVLVCHALTGSADVDDWWAGLIGAGKALDPEHDFIICSNVLGGCYGSTGPQSINPATGERYASEFPVLTVRDLVAGQQKLVQALGIDELSFVVGPSLGGMQVLEWAASFPGQLKSFAPIGVSYKHSAWCIGTSEAQRQAIFRDSRWCEGNYSPEQPPQDGFAVARMMAMLSYRSWDNFEDRFGRQISESEQYAIESYLNYQGDKICQRFDPLSYVRLTQTMDSHSVGRARGGHENALAEIDIPALVVSIDTDVLYPPREQQALATELANAEFVTLPSAHGHDGFLIDTEYLGEQIKAFRQKISNVGVAAKAIA